MTPLDASFDPIFTNVVVYKEIAADSLRAAEDLLVAHRRPKDDGSPGEAFYGKLMWVVDGTRRKRDRTQIIRAWQDGSSMGRNSLVQMAFSDDCALLRE